MDVSKKVAWYKIHQAGPTMVSKWCQLFFSCGQNCVLCSQWNQNGPRSAQGSSMVPQGDPSWFALVSRDIKADSRLPKMVPRESPQGPKTSPRELEEVQDRSKYYRFTKTQFYRLFQLKPFRTLPVVNGYDRGALYIACHALYLGFFFQR